MTALKPFANEPVLELRRAAARAALVEGMAWLERRLPLGVPVWIGDERGASEGLDSTDPADPDRVVATAGVATAADVDRAVETAAAGVPGLEHARRRPSARRRWSRAAAWMRERRPKLAALAVRECAKPWGEADADVCEAIDFLEYYARGAIELDRDPPLLQVPGERNAMRWRPRGVTAVIAPWNFPVAIPCGMTAAALATGNAAILKPAEQSPGCAFVLVEALRAGGVPPDALALLPGEGDVGAALVRHPGVHTIAFTGSAAVGLEILRDAAEVRRRPAPPQARDRRDGRQELRDRRLRRRPRRGRARDRAERLRVRGPEVLGRGAGARARGGGRPPGAAPCWGGRPCWSPARRTRSRPTCRR